MKPISLLMRIVFLALMLLGAAACGTNDDSKSLGTLDANGGGIDGSVPAGTQRVYTLRGLVAGYDYTVRTTVTQTNLALSIYRSEDEYKNGGSALASGAPVFIDVVDVDTEGYPTTSYYEVHFQPDTAGNYVVVLSASQDAEKRDIFFYDLRLLSSDVVQTLSSPETTSSITAGALHIYNGALLPSLISGQSYSISLRSDTTTTVYCPQVFIFNNSDLLLRSLQHSLITDATGTFVIYDFTYNSGISTGSGTQRPGSVNPLSSSGATITTMPISSGSSTGPFIMIKGRASANYTLTIQ